jgi:hypothetical protein
MELDLSTLITISCILTGVTMVVFVGFIAFFGRYGGKGVQSLLNRFLGGANKDEKAQDSSGGGQQRPVASSSQSFRQRAQSLDFPVQAGAQQFSAQALPQQGQYPDFPVPQQPSLTPRMGQGQLGGTQQFRQQQSFRPSTPSLSPSRPFTAGFTQAGYPQQGNLGQQGGFQQTPPLRQAPPLQQGGFNAQTQGGFQQTPPLRQAPPLQQGGFNAQTQGGFQQTPPLRQAPPLQQGGFQQAVPPQQAYNQQAPQQGGLGQNRPPLQSRPRPDQTNFTGRRQISPRRDNRHQDDYDQIYDDGEMGGLGDILDGF